MLVTYCCDVGSVKAGNFGWVRAWNDGARLRVAGSKSIDECIDALNRDLDEGRVVTLGMESPLFLPIPSIKGDLSTGRDGDGNRSSFAPAGASVATLGLHELAYIVAKLSRGAIRPKLDWTTWDRDDAGELLMWEAFVSGKAHTKSRNHQRDAATAAVAFMNRIKRKTLKSDVTVKPPRKTLSLAGAVVLWSGWSTDLTLLNQPTFVVKPTHAYRGSIEDA